MFTKTSIAQMAVHTVIAANVAKVVRNFVADNTEIDEEAISLKVGSLVAGDLVACKTDRYTDAMIEKIAAKWAARKADTIATEL